MDNNSKDTLFGFETFTDLFSDKNQNDYSSEIDDEELERLKQNSRNNNLS